MSSIHQREDGSIGSIRAGPSSKDGEHHLPMVLASQDKVARERESKLSKHATRQVDQGLGSFPSSRRKLAALGLIPVKFTSHSFLRGGATSLALAGVPENVIAAMGHWKSTTFQLYIDLPREAKFKAHRAMVVFWCARTTSHEHLEAIRSGRHVGGTKRIP
jgi:hypothetical protein